MKPHITYLLREWECRWGTAVGLGDTPIAAWNDLQNVLALRRSIKLAMMEIEDRYR